MKLNINLFFILIFLLDFNTALAVNNYKHGTEFNPNIIYPIISGKIIEKYGWKKFNSDDFKSYTLISSKDKTVYAAANGKVIVSGYLEKEGVIVIQSEGFFTVYKGIHKFYVGRNSKVFMGQKIGGIDGNLKFEVRDLLGNAYDSENYIKKNTVKKIRVNSELFKSFSAFMQLHGFSEREIPVMYCIAKLESSFNPRAQNFNRNKTFDTGIFQINDIWLKQCQMSRKDLFDVRNNAKCARLVLYRQGFTAWTTYKQFYPHRCS
nr:hypothetical protein GTC16762_31050 [Pigmentibacter ruber]